MRAIAVTRKEGGEWICFEPPTGYHYWTGPGGTIHAIKFDNGCIWDTVNGWRKNVRIRVKMARA